ncbi:MAG: hypothetical protein ACM3JG_02745 [Thiohalocapsa sp.]
MKHLVIGIAAALTLAIAPVRAQVPPPWTQQAQWVSPDGYPMNAATPEDAYRQGLINRWELEQLVGPLPQALQGPSVNGERGDSDGSRQ